jgi:hypothetical protein
MNIPNNKDDWKRTKDATDTEKSACNGLLVLKSTKQITLERQGCVFRVQELLDNHELDTEKECYCGRPNNNKTKKLTQKSGACAPGRRRSLLQL